jgi:hypothetical protein
MDIWNLVWLLFLAIEFCINFTMVFCVYVGLLFYAFGVWEKIYVKNLCGGVCLVIVGCMVLK